MSQIWRAWTRCRRTSRTRCTLRPVLRPPTRRTRRSRCPRPPPMTSSSCRRLLPSSASQSRASSRSRSVGQASESNGQKWCHSFHRCHPICLGSKRVCTLEKYRLSPSRCDVVTERDGAGSALSELPPHAAAAAEARPGAAAQGRHVARDAEVRQRQAVSSSETFSDFFAKCHSVQRKASVRETHVAHIAGNFIHANLTHCLAQKQRCVGQSKMSVV